MRERERARERVKEIQLFFHFTSSKKPFSSHSERAEGKLGELCDSWWNFVQLLLVSQHNLLNHFRGSLNRLRCFFPVCDTRKRGRKGKNFVIFATIISPPRYLYLYIPQDRISKDFWIYAVWKKRERERMRAKERSDNYICPVSETFIKANDGGVRVARPGLHRRTSSSINVLCVCVLHVGSQSHKIHTNTHTHTDIDTHRYVP